MTEKLIDLTGATVTVPAGWSAESSFLGVSLKYYAETSISYTVKYFCYNSLIIGYEALRSGKIIRATPRSDRLCLVDSDSLNAMNYTPTESFTIYIIGGEDVTNPDLIQWFVDNHAVIEWKEKESSLIIKNPICLIESKAKKVVVDNVNMTIDVYTKEVPASLISFTVDGTSYQAEEGMTWEEWCNSEYNTTFTVETDGIFNDSSHWVAENNGDAVRSNDLIIENHNYILGTGSSGGSGN